SGTELGVLRRHRNLDIGAVDHHDSSKQTPPAQVAVELKEAMTALPVIVDGLRIRWAQEPIRFEQRAEYVIADSIVVAADVTQHAEPSGPSAVHRHRAAVWHAKSGLRHDVHHAAKAVSILGRESPSHHVRGINYIGTEAR